MKKRRVFSAVIRQGARSFRFVDDTKKTVFVLWKYEKKEKEYQTFFDDVSKNYYIEEISSNDDVLRWYLIWGV